MTLPMSKRQTATVTVFRALFATQSAMVFLVFGTLVPPQMVPFSYTSTLGTFNNFTGFTANGGQLNQLNLIYGQLYLQYNTISQQPALMYFQVAPPGFDPSDTILDNAISAALTQIQALNTLVQDFTPVTINGNSNQPDLSTLQNLVLGILNQMTQVSGASDDE